MKIAIVGANSQVGTEVCLLLRNWGESVIPVVRSKQAASFLQHKGFSCRIAEISNSSDAQTVLSDADLVVIASYVSDVGGPSKRSRSILTMLISNSVQYATKAEKIIYFSSIRAFSRKIDPKTALLGAAYDWEKKYGEKILFQACRHFGKQGYSLRLGHVFGQNQGKTRTILKILESNQTIGLQTEATRLSNIVHTVTIADAIQRIIDKEVYPGTYSLVNHPQWTWQEVFEYYSLIPKNIEFFGAKKKKAEPFWKTSPFQTFLQNLFSLGRPVISLLRPLIVPVDIDQQIQYKMVRNKVRSEINSWKPKPLLVFIPEFSYKPIPGPFITQLRNTTSLLSEYDLGEDFSS